MRLHVPVNTNGCWETLRMFHTPMGERTAVAFSSPGLLAATLGDNQGWVTMSERALHEAAEARGVTRVTLDPALALPAPAMEQASLDGWDIAKVYTESASRLAHPAGRMPRRPR